MIESVARRNLEEIAAILDDMGLVWWFHGGTALGVIRDNDIMPHDGDTDIGLYPGTETAPVIERLLEAGYTLLHTYGTPDYGMERTVVKDGVRTDIFRHYPTEDGTKWWFACWGGDGRVLRYELTPFGIHAVHTLGFPSFVPFEYDRYLTEMYGDWRTPVTEWRIDRDPPNLVYFGDPSAYRGQA